MALANVCLDDKYTLDSGRIYLTGIQALVRLPLVQRKRDLAAGLNTAGYISGYRGSPLGALDQNLWKARSLLEQHHVRFHPGLNEDLAATAVWGSQQVNLFEGARYDGVFAMWYGKGPGVDRTGDVFKHANVAGTSRHGGVLVLAGDDLAAKSSTMPHQSQYAFMDAQMPVLNPAGVQDVLDLGVLGWELSRYSGCWVGFKTIAETVDSSASVYVDPHRLRVVMPADFELPPGGVHMRWPDKPLEQELRLQQYKLYAALAFARANNLNRVTVDSPSPRFGIVTTGKSYLDVRQALDDLGIDERLAARIGLRVYKVGMTWPLEREGIRAFARGLEELLVVEEKRAVIENQVKEQLYNWDPAVRPRVIGKFDEKGEWILPSANELTPARIARVIAARIGRFYTSDVIQARLAFLEAKEAALARPRLTLERTPHFCSGCPHNTSTRVPEGSRSMAGIGCHYMATWMNRNTETYTQMGGEGVPWIGQAPFTDTRHVFANLGDGTYFHSGLLAVRAAIAAGVNITYKLLYNDAVAMTGGQPIDGVLTVAQITRQLSAEGVARILVVSDAPEKYPDRTAFAAGVTFHHRRELDLLQRQLREDRGVSVLIYDQTCAAEKRRRRKRGLMEDPARRAFINELVCEGCGDCGEKSNCLSVVPVETELGRKRAIDQSACNKDMSCLEGFCPSFVTVHGGRLRKPLARTNGQAFPPLPDPKPIDSGAVYSIVITGVGGTGVVTIGALLGMAAHLEGKGVSVLDMTGLAQKYGAVVSHVRIASKPEDIHAVRIPAGEASLLLGCDLVVASGTEALSKLDRRTSHTVVNAHESATARFIHEPDLVYPGRETRQSISDAIATDSAHFVDATALATALLGDSIATNLFMVGYAWQRGLVPLSLEAIERAIELNGVAVEANKQALLWGRRAAHDEPAVRALLDAGVRPKPVAHTLDGLVQRRVAYLSEYQDFDYAARYAKLVRRVRDVERARASGRKGLAEAVAHSYFKLLAYKDEYEVARLYTSEEFRRQLQAQFEGDYRLEFHLAPPLLAKVDPASGRVRKRAYGAWMMGVFKLLARLKGLRGTAFDIFGYHEDRRLERQLIRDYERTVDELLLELDREHHALAVEIASLPRRMKGYGGIKRENVEKARRREAELLRAYRDREAPPHAA